MHIQVINYQRTFNLGNYASEKIGVEVAINAGEDAKEALETAKSLVEEYHKENVAKLKDLGYFYEDQIQVEIIPTQSKETRDEKTKMSIEDIKSLITETLQQPKLSLQVNQTSQQLSIVINRPNDLEVNYDDLARKILLVSLFIRGDNRWRKRCKTRMHTKSGSR